MKIMVDDISTKLLGIMLVLILIIAIALVFKRLLQSIIAINILNALTCLEFVIAILIISSFVIKNNYTNELGMLILPHTFLSIIGIYFIALVTLATILIPIAVYVYWLIEQKAIKPKNYEQYPENALTVILTLYGIAMLLIAVVILYVVVLLITI